MQGAVIMIWPLIVILIATLLAAVLCVIVMRQ
jgi:hypothetical protein